MCGVLPKERENFGPFARKRYGKFTKYAKKVDNKKEISTINKQQTDNNLNNSPATAPKTLMCFKSFKFIITENTNYIIMETHG